MKTSKILIANYEDVFAIGEDEIEKNIQAIKEFRKSGNVFVLMTGDNYNHFSNMLVEHNIKYDYLILDQGSVIVNKRNQFLKTCFINPDIIDDIYNEIESNIEEEDNFVFCNPLFETNKKIKNDLTKISINMKNKKNAEKMAKHFEKTYKDDINVYINKSEDNNTIEIISSNIDRVESAKFIVASEMSKKENVYVVGDNECDIPLMKYYEGYCLKTADEKITKVAKKKIGSVKDLAEKLTK